MNEGDLSVAAAMLIMERGRGILRDPEAARALLAARLPQSPEGADLLAAALRAGLGEDLAAPLVPPEREPQLAELVEYGQGVRPEDAAMAVRVWMRACGHRKDFAAPTVPDGPPPPTPPIPPAPPAAQAQPTWQAPQQTWQAPQPEQRPWQPQPDYSVNPYTAYPRGPMYGQPPPNINTHLTKSLITLLCFGCMPIAVVALVFSIMTSTKISQGDYQGAQDCSNKASLFGNISLGLGAALILFYIFAGVLSLFAG